MRILVLGAGGMIGNSIFRILNNDKDIEVYGAIRDIQKKNYFSTNSINNILQIPDLMAISSIKSILKKVNPDVVINCVGITKHRFESNSPRIALSINTLLPHQLAYECLEKGVRLIHISTDCVFSGKKGGYVEQDKADAGDLYGKSKAMGEITDLNALTIRVSTIGHELGSNYGLLEWFLAQKSYCDGFSGAYFTGMPACVLATVIKDFIFENQRLNGLYHIGSNPINKFELLNLIAEIYNKKIEIRENKDLIIDRSLSFIKFQNETDYKPIPWRRMIEIMHANRSVGLKNA